MRLDELSGRSVALLGLGADVRAAVPVIMGVSPADVFVVDDAAEGAVTIGDHTFPVVTLDEACATAEIMVRSPGFPRYLPVLVAAREAGVEMTTPVDLFLSRLRPNVTRVLVTGTKGKSTTTELIGHLARDAGLDVGVAGNLGIPVFSDGWRSDAPIIVLEVSSYQASDLHTVPDIAVVTSLAEDHLSWHGGLDAYLADKLRVVSNDGAGAGTVIVPAAESHARAVLAQRFPDVEPVLVEELPSNGVIPTHRLRNAALAARVVTELGGVAPSADEITRAASHSMPGRLDVCAERDSTGGILFVDDALASNPSATAAGLGWARQNSSDVIVILGGRDRGVSDEPLREEAQRWTNEPGLRLRAVTVPESGRQLAISCGIEVVAEAGDVDSASRDAYDILSGSAGSPMVIFSPAAPTPPGSGNWETRSAEFREAVSAISSS